MRGPECPGTANKTASTRDFLGAVFFLDGTDDDGRNNVNARVKRSNMLMAIKKSDANCSTVSQRTHVPPNNKYQNGAMRTRRIIYSSNATRESTTNR